MQEEELVSELLQRLWDRLVHRGGSAKSAQGKLIQCIRGIQGEFYGMLNVNWDDEKYELNIAGYPEGYLPDNYGERYAFSPDFSMCRTTKEDLDNASYYDASLNWMKKWLEDHPLPEWSDQDIHKLQSCLERLRPRIPIGVCDYDMFDKWDEWDKKNRKSETSDTYWKEGGCIEDDEYNYIDAQILYWIYRNPDLVDLEDKPLGITVLDVFEYISERTSHTAIAIQLLEALAKNPGAPIDLQKHLSAWTEDKKVRCAVAANQNASDTVLEHLSRDKEWRVRCAVAENENTPAAVLGCLMEDRDKSIRRAAAGNKNAPADVLGHLAESEGWTVAENPNAPSLVRERLVDDKPEWSRVRVASNYSTTIALLEHLSGDESTRVRCAVAANPSTSVAVLEFLAGDESTRVRCAVAENTSTSVARLEFLAGDEYYGVRSGVAANPKAPIAVLERLAKERKVAVLSAVAENPNTPGTVLERLARSKRIVLRSAVASNPSTPQEVLERLVVGAQPDVRRALAGNSFTPQPILERLVMDEHPDIRCAVAQNLNSSATVWKHLWEYEGLSVLEIAASNPAFIQCILEELAGAFPWDQEAE